MNRQETTRLLAYVNRATGQPIETETPEVWHDLIGHLPHDVAEQAVKSALADPDRGGRWLQPADVLRVARNVRADQIKRERAATHGSDAHCGNAGCRCTHTEDCYRGWKRSILDPEAIAPCFHCRGALHSVLVSIPDPGKRTAADHALIQRRDKDTP